MAEKPTLGEATGLVSVDELNKEKEKRKEAEDRAKDLGFTVSETAKMMTELRLENEKLTAEITKAIQDRDYAVKETVTAKNELSKYKHDVGFLLLKTETLSKDLAAERDEKSRLWKELKKKKGIEE